MNVDVRTLQLAIATAMATSSTIVAYAVAPDQFLIVGVLQSQMATVIVMETKPMRLACAVEAARQMLTEMASVTMSMTALALWTHAAFAMVQVPSMTAVATTSPMAIAIAVESKWTPWASVGEIVCQTITTMASVTSMRAPVAPMRRRATLIHWPSLWMTLRRTITV